MITGVETAGLVLGIFPIVLKGLSQFIEGLETMKDMQQFRRLLDKYREDLSHERHIFGLTLQQLFICSKIAKTEREMYELLDNPYSDDWKAPKYDEALRLFLDKSYDVYMNTVTSLWHSLESLYRKLLIELEPSGSTAAWDRLSYWRRKFKEVKITLSKKEFDEKLRRVERMNSELRAFTYQNEYLDYHRSQKRNKTRLAEDLTLIRRQYVSLHGALTNSNFWDCVCDQRHVASLRLERRRRSREDVQPKDIENPRACSSRLLLAKSFVQQGNSSEPAWKAFEIQSGGSSDSSQTSDSPVRPSKSCGDASNELSSTLGRAIVNFCDTLLKDKVDLQQGSLGYFSDSLYKENRHGVHYLGECVSQQPISLESCLMADSGPVSGKSLYRGDRLFLAVILASSMIQIGDTPWLGKFWSSADIILFQQSDARLRDFDLNETYPYLSWSLSTFDAHMNDEFDLPEEVAHFIRSKPVVALGLTLVELCFGRNLQAMCEAEDVTSSSLGTKMATARRLLEDVQLEEGDVYRIVTDRCLQSKFDVFEFDLNNGGFRDAMLQDVVEPLIETLDDFNGKAAYPRSKKGKRPKVEFL